MKKTVITLQALITYLLWSGLLASKVIVTTPMGGLCNQLYSIGHAMSVANLTNRDFQIAGLKASYDEARTMRADLILDLQYLQDVVAPLMGITKPNFQITAQERNVSKECSIGQIETDKDIALNWVRNETRSKCEAIDIKFAFYHTGSGGFSYLGPFLQRFVFSSHIRDIASKYRQTALMDCHDALVIHFRVESDMILHISHYGTLHVNGIPVKDRWMIEHMFIRAYQKAAESTLSKLPDVQCVYICTDAKKKVINDYKEFLHSIKPSLAIHTNSFHALSEKDKGVLATTRGNDREVRAAVELEIAFLVGKHLIGTKRSTYSNTLQIKLGSLKRGHVSFIDQYLQIS